MPDIIFESLRFLTGVFIGLALGMTGGGGSLLLPTFTYLFGLPVQLATGYTLILTGATAAIGVISRVRSREVFDQVPDVVFQTEGFRLGKRTFVMFLFASIVLLSWATMIGLIGQNLKPNPKLRTEQPSRYFGILVVCGFAIGILTAFIGAGGGVMLVPLMVIVMGLEMRTVVGTTLLIVAIKSSIGFAGDLWTQAADIDGLFLAKFFVTMVVGVLLGSAAANRVSPKVLKVGFAWFLLFIASFVIAKETLF